MVHIPGLLRELGGLDGALTFDEAIMHTTGQGLILKGAETRLLSSSCDAGDVNVGDLPVHFLDSISGKIEQFCDAIQHASCYVTRRCRSQFQVCAIFEARLFAPEQDQRQRSH